MLASHEADMQDNGSKLAINFVQVKIVRRLMPAWYIHIWALTYSMPSLQQAPAAQHCTQVR